MTSKNVVRISEKIDVKSSSDTITNVLAIIDSIHKDGMLPVIPLEMKALREFEDGVYHHHNDEQRGISIDPQADMPEITVVHEIGHFLDNKGLPSKKAFASLEEDVLGEWWATVKETQPIKHLEYLQRSPSVRYVTPAGTVNRPVLQKRVSYLLDRREIWARSYSQYISNASKNPTLIKQVEDTIRTPDHTAYPEFWSDPKEFAKVQSCIERAFHKRKWC